MTDEESISNTNTAAEGEAAEKAIKPEKTPEEVVIVDNADETIQKAKDAAEEIREANKETEKLIERQEKLKALESLGGKTKAGKKQEISAVEYMKKVMANDIPTTD